MSTPRSTLQHSAFTKGGLSRSQPSSQRRREEGSAALAGALRRAERVSESELKVKPLRRCEHREVSIRPTTGVSSTFGVFEHRGVPV